MEISVFVSTMRMEGDALLRRMGLRGENCAIINQCGREAIREIGTDACRARVYDSAETGLSRSRNRALALASGDLIWMCDDDLRIAEGYEESVLAAFREYPDADAIAFNVPCDTPGRAQKPISAAHRVTLRNGLRYPTYRMVYRVSSVKERGLAFDERFGSGSLYSSGEDSLFTVRCLQKGMRIYAVPAEIARVSHTDSGWFSGFTEKYLTDKGALFRAMFGAAAPFYTAAMLFRRGEWRKDRSFLRAYSVMLRGGREFAKTERNPPAK